jgi:hypothetical protein
MNLKLDHIFILTNKPKETGDALVSIGLNESFSRDHKGQGTSNRRFEFSNGMLEILFLRDYEEAYNGPAKKLRFPERLKEGNASPIGIVLTRTSDSDLGMPFGGWAYQPDYFEPPNAFHVGNNSEILQEPLCIYVPFVSPSCQKEVVGEFGSISNVLVSVPVGELSETLRMIQTAEKLEVETGSEHLVELTLDRHTGGKSKDFRPDLTLIINW